MNLPGTVMTFQEREGDVLELVRRRLRDGAGRVRNSGSDYLAYATADPVVVCHFLFP
jgi:magnesium transporter